MTQPAIAVAPASKSKNAALWALQILTALAFLGAAGAKFAGVPQMVATFQKVGVGQWFRYVTALLELAGAFGLLIPRYTFYAAVLLATVMVGAVIAHLTVIGENPAPAIVLLAFTATIAYFRK
jgi:uncharacterized membrane protein YphA (DoxX/SURF4 family)